MADIFALLWDVGGIFLTNGWDHVAQREAARRFGFDFEEFRARHDRVVGDFEIGRTSLDEYLGQTLFDRPRPFSQQALRDFIFSCSQPFPDALALGKQLARSGKYLMAAVNNESLELNQYRIRQFALTDLFRLFFSSCFVGLAKPDPALFRLVLRVTQLPPAACLFADDRPGNLEPAKVCGIHTILYENPSQLRDALKDLGVLL